MNEEKYITISYEKWVTFYGPLEKEVERLKYELEEAKRDKTIEIVLQRQGWSHSSHLTGWFNPGFASMKEDIAGAIKTALTAIDKIDFYENMDVEAAHDGIRTKEAALKEQAESLYIREKAVLKVPRFIRWIFGLNF